MKNNDSHTIIMGVDPGTIVTGYGIIKKQGNSIIAIDYGCIRPPAKLKLSDRYLIIYDSLVALIAAHEPNVVIVETQFVKKNVQSAIKLGMARGIAMLAAKKSSLPVFEYSPRKAKQSVVGNGAGSKKQVQWMIQQLLRLAVLPQPDDAADALALALCHLQAANSPKPPKEV